MGILDFFRPVRSMSADEAREYVEGKNEGEYRLLDVRQPAEYAEGHLPGAVHIPLPELQDRMGELDPGVTTIVYCRSGVRSRTATGMLAGAGFKSAINMLGGISAYRGVVAGGGPEAGMFCFPAGMDTARIAAVAWLVEDGTLRFFEAVMEKCDACREPGLFGMLVEDKKNHRERLGELYRELSGEAPGADFPKGIGDMPVTDVMAGCADVRSAIGWAQGREPSQVLEFVMSAEANAVDIYTRLGRVSESGEARRIFTALAGEERRMLSLAAGAYERAIEKQ